MAKHAWVLPIIMIIVRNLAAVRPAWWPAGSPGGPAARLPGPQGSSYRFTRTLIRTNMRLDSRIGRPGNSGLTA